MDGVPGGRVTGSTSSIFPRPRPQVTMSEQVFPAGSGRRNGHEPGHRSAMVGDLDNRAVRDLVKQGTGVLTEFSYSYPVHVAQRSTYCIAWRIPSTWQHADRLCLGIRALVGCVNYFDLKNAAAG